MTTPTTPDHSTAFADWLQEFEQRAIKSGDEAVITWLSSPNYSEKLKNLLQRMVSYSPYLTKAAEQHPQILQSYATHGADAAWHILLQEAAYECSNPSTTAALMQTLRVLKSRAALLIALADIDGIWPLSEVTHALSTLADMVVHAALHHLLRQAHTRGEIQLANFEQPAEHCGIIILGMGKLGAYELNYSSDIDLIVFYEKDALGYAGKQGEQKFLNKLVQELVTILHERTADGYVFRTDLRLRPDPSSTPLAVSVNAAMHYYESVGQNWERAAMIKARPIAGDMRAGENLMKQLVPFVWRKSLDFATIQDILSIKRQIHHKIGSEIHVAGHNIKLGSGGIREIEFFVQLHQLIWGGRQLELRGKPTLEVLSHLVDLKHVMPEIGDYLRECYVYYRTLEHRLQMVADQQTHTIPEAPDALAGIAAFMGEADVNAFEAALKEKLTRVHDIFVHSFNSEGLSADEGNLVFTGTQNDPATLLTLREMGFSNAEAVSETIQGWHHGSRRCTRTKRARQILTELVPTLLSALSKTAQPDAAFLNFDHFLADLPAGVQIFSLFASNPHLLTLIAEIMGTAPTLSSTLSKQPELLESVLLGDFYHSLPDAETLARQLESALNHTEYFDASMEILRQFKSEKQFQAGVQMLSDMVAPEQVARYLTDLADILLQKAFELTQAEFARQYGIIEGAAFAIMALGKLGARELTFGSDIDLIFIYDTPDFEQLSNGSQPHSASVYYNRFAQRLIGALTTVGMHGQLFEVDTRLRPSGKQGLLAVSQQAFVHYFESMAWTFEHMALVKGRVVAGDVTLHAPLTAHIRSILTRPRDKKTILNDIHEMRKRVAQEFPTERIWDIKHIAGGLMDIDFIAQSLLLCYGHQHPELLHARSRDIFAAARALPELTTIHPNWPQMLECLIEANDFLTRLQHILRLTSEDAATLEHPPAGLANTLTRFMHEAHYEALKNHILSIETRVREVYIQLIPSN